MSAQQKIRALDFEMFNTKHYWSICWAGVVLAGDDLQPVSVFDRVINPRTREKFIGKTMTLPFTAKELTRYPTFDRVAREIFAPLEGALVIGHALENDLKMIADVCKKYSLTPPQFDYIDTNVCYNARFGQNTEHSLTRLCEQFDITFTAHDPSEDARAALAVIEKLADGDLDGFLDAYGIVKGRFAGGLVRRTYFESMPERQKERVILYNRIFDAAERMGQGQGKGYYLSSQLAMDCDLTKVAEGLLRQGKRLTIDSYTADYIVTNDLTLGKRDAAVVPLREIVRQLGLCADEFDYLPRKVTDEAGKGISMTEYYTRVFADRRGEGALSGKTLCFCKAVERRADYPELFLSVVQAGGTVTARMDRGVVFIVNKMSDLSGGTTDGRIIAYKRSSGKKTVMTLKELSLKL